MQQRTKSFRRQEHTGWNQVFALIALVTLLLGQGTPLQAWGRLGHHLIARLAESRLSLEARAEVAAILGSDTMAGVSLWADEIKKARPETATWHYVRYPQGMPPNQSSLPLSTTETTILTALESCRQILAETGHSPIERREALCFLIHLVGDLHQPLHCGPDGDMGGNLVKLWYFSRPTNLHKLWDSGLVESAGVDEDTYLRFLQSEDPESGPAAPTARQIDDPLAWSRESCTVAIHQAYVLPYDLRLDERYYTANIRTMNRQLARGGHRLAGILNSLFADRSQEKIQAGLPQAARQPMAALSAGSDATTGTRN